MQPDPGPVAVPEDHSSRPGGGPDPDCAGDHPGPPAKEDDMTTTTSNQPDLSLVKVRQQQTWASGDYTVIAGRIVLVSELLAEAADLHAGWRVLDVACGNGNATLAASRAGTRAVGVDYVPSLIESARDRAVTEGLDARFEVGDAEALPVEDGEFD